ncbi:hypothetical protein [Thermoflexus sp.]|uniref:hypothetical protein n=1 Tax=Thermoflexus sp. TaxID=1969742 RepID=UPI0017555109|nr:hypothetical protein [Thermoflexus sp.]
MLILVLVSMALMWTLWRAWLPVGVAAPGRLLLEVPLGWRERWRWHRKNLYALAILILLGALGGWLPLLGQGMIAGFALLVLLLPLRYRFTEEGVALNNVFFRRWEEFRAYRAEPWGIRLEGAGPPCALYLPPEARNQVQALVGARLRYAPLRVSSASRKEVR